MILYDAIGTLSDTVGQGVLAQYIDLLLPPLLAKWVLLKDTDSDLFPLLECMASVATALGITFAPYASGVTERCLRLIESGLFEMQYADTNASDFIIVSLELLSGVAEGLGSSFESLVAGPGAIRTAAGTDMLKLLLQCCTIDDAHVQQSAFALLGDLAKVCCVHLRPYMYSNPGFICAISQNIFLRVTAVCNNVLWSLGELALQVLFLSVSL